ncbi:MAG: hypothetical protein KGN84_07730, partial [Acidobacteriota bacterium]|nr:hypothetical protein [Acidobacteriota bacterium]
MSAPGIEEPIEEGGEPVTYRFDRVIPAFVLVVTVSVLAFRFFSLISAYSVNVLFFDQWDFLQPFFDGDFRLSRLFLEEPTPFREGLGLIVDRPLYALT